VRARHFIYINECDTWQLKFLLFRATSALDAASETLVNSALARVTSSQSLTTIIIVCQLAVWLQGYLSYRASGLGPSVIESQERGHNCLVGSRSSRRTGVICRSVTRRNSFLPAREIPNAGDDASTGYRWSKGSPTVVRGGGFVGHRSRF
jgi:hypothetical protein